MCSAVQYSVTSCLLPLFGTMWRCLVQLFSGLTSCAVPLFGTVWCHVQCCRPVQCDVMCSATVHCSVTSCAIPLFSTMWRHVQCRCPVQCDVMCSTVVSYSVTSCAVPLFSTVWRHVQYRCSVQCDFMCNTAVPTPSPKQPFSFLGQLAINSARHAKQLFSSVPAGVWLCCLWQCLVHSGGWDYRVICVFPVFIAIKEVTKISLYKLQMSNIALLTL